jgi:hypothetical protein
MSTAHDAAPAGLVFRGIFGALVLGTLAYWVLFSANMKVRRTAAVVGVVAGFLTAKLWGHVGVDWSSNLLNWFQQASTLTLVGGLRGVGTRLTVLLAVLGGSLATAAGRHVTIDLITRYLPVGGRMPLVVSGWIATAVICAAASWGFFDHIAIENFGANATASAGEKIKKVGHELGEYAFVTRKQIQLDVRTFPLVMRGESYSHWLTGVAWDDFLNSSGFIDRYGKEAVDALRISPDGTRSPIVAIPGKGEPRGALTEAANLAFPIGLLIISLRFLLLSILAASGHMKIDLEAHMDMGTKREGAAV